MGGLLSAEVILLPGDHGNALKHRILGSINLDVPFLGMHPGVIRSGLASIFQPGPDLAPDPTSPPSAAESAPNKKATQDSSRPSLAHTSSTSSLDLPSDPNYNPAYDNDIYLPARQGWRNVLHFINKHSDHLISGTSQLIRSHMEFGGAMADYAGLKKRYYRIRSLEEDGEAVRRAGVGAASAPPRVRFVNYYTASTGRPKPIKAKEKAEVAEFTKDASSAETFGKSRKQKSNPAENESSSPQPRRDRPGNDSAKGKEIAKPTLTVTEAPVEEDSDQDYEQYEHSTPETEMSHIVPGPMSSESEMSDSDTLAETVSELQLEPQPSGTEQSQTMEPQIHEPANLPPTNSSLESTRPSLTLGPLPDLPSKPLPPDPSAHTDPSMRKVAEKEYTRAQRAYDRAVRDRDKAVRDRVKLDEKWARKRRKPSGENVDQEGSGVRDGTESDKVSGLGRERAMVSETTTTGAETATSAPNAADHDYDDPPESSISDHELDNQATSSPLGSARATHKSLQPPKEAKERKFCTLPPPSSNGAPDPCWARVLMKNMDEVSAHCGLFFASREGYEELVGDVAERVRGWVEESEGERVARLVQGWEMDGT